MALRTTWGAWNRVISQDLNTTVNRELTRMTVFDSGGIDAVVWQYTRTRRKSYSYIGMTHDAAMRCVASLNALYTRKQRELILTKSSTAGTMSYMTRWIDLANEKDYITERVFSGGVAVPTYESGDAWSVKVDVNEVLTFKYRNDNVYTTQTNYDRNEISVGWLDFENNPELRNAYGIGMYPDDDHGDYNYDEAYVGYGSADYI